MKNHELLDMIGDVNEDYVLAADSNVIRPQFRWKVWAACAACTALVLCAWPIYSKMAAPTADLATGPEQDAHPTLHAYTIMEDGGAMAFQGELKAPAGGVDDSAPEANAEGRYYGETTAGLWDSAADGGFTGFQSPEGDIAAAITGEPAPDPALFAPMIDQSAAIMQYQRLYEVCDLDGDPPAWYAGAWLDNDQPDNVARLAVSIVAGYHTPELEAQIEEWCQGGVLFVQDMKYSYAQLLNMLNRVNQALMDPSQDETWSVFSFMCIDIENNCLYIDFFGIPSDGALALLAQLDPEGDAIQVRAFTGHINVTEDLVKAPEPPEPAVPGGAWVGDDYCEPEPTPTPVDGSEPEPAAISVAPSITEQSHPARTEDGHDIPGSMFEK